MAAISLRINTLLLVLLVLMAGAIIAMLATRAYGGPLDPTGPPASTDGVRGPGTPISSLPFAIDTPGYYYVTRDLTGGAGQAGITISVSNVTVDLGGFTLTGGTNPQAGIYNFGARNIAVRNGAVRSWSSGVFLGGQYSRVERISAMNNGFTGIYVGPQSEISDCNASLNFNGIELSDSTVRNCTVAENGGIGIQVPNTNNSSLIEGNRVNVNQDFGIRLYGNRNMIVDNQLSGNIGTDLLIGGGSTTYNVITGNVYCTAIDSGTNTTGVGNYC